MVEIVIHQSGGNAGWYIKQSDGSISKEGFVLGNNPNAYTEVTYQAAIDALASVPMSETVVFSSPQSNTLARKRKQKDQIQVYLDFQRCISGRTVRFNPIDADCDRANYAKQVARRANADGCRLSADFTPDYIAYTDGSCNNLSPYGEGGAAYVILDGQRNLIKKNSKGFIGVTGLSMRICEQELVA